MSDHTWQFELISGSLADHMCIYLTGKCLQIEDIGIYVRSYLTDNTWQFELIGVSGRSYIPDR